MGVLTDFEKDIYKERKPLHKVFTVGGVGGTWNKRHVGWVVLGKWDASKVEGTTPRSFSEVHISTPQEFRHGNQKEGRPR